MKTRNIIYIILLGFISLYCAKIFIQASVIATNNSFEAYNSILGWTMYLLGWILFVGGIVATAVNLVATSKEQEE